MLPYQFFSIFIMKGYCILPKTFDASVDMIMWLLFFLVFGWSITFIDLHSLNHSCIPVRKPTWSWYVVFLMIHCILLASVLLRIFPSIFIKGFSQEFSFLILSLWGFGIKASSVCSNDFGNTHSLLISSRNLNRIDHRYFQKFL